MARRAPRPKRNHWCFTSYLDVLPSNYDLSVVRYICYQRETCPDSKRQHFQGYVEFYDPKRLSFVKSLLGELHAESRRGSRTEARNYCKKLDSAVGNTFVEFGEWRIEANRKRKLCDLLKANMTLDDLIEESPAVYVRYYRGLKDLYARRQKKKACLWRDVEVIVLVGPTGSGKTRRACAYQNHFKLPVSDKLWFDGYELTDKTLIIDDFYGGIKYGFLLQILDGHELQLPVKGGFIWAMWTRVVITSNAEPDEWYRKLFPDCMSPALARRITRIIHMEVRDIDADMCFV